MTDTAPPRWATYMPLAELPPATRNAKAHDQPALARSVEAFGFVEPVVLDERTGQLVAGHGRTAYLAELEAAGADPPEGVAVGEDGKWRVLVTRGWASRDDAHATAAGVALNRVGERGGWDPSLLAEDLAWIRDSNLLDAAGFTSDYLDDLVASCAPPSTLDDLADKHGDSDPTDFWPVLRFKVSPAQRARYLRLVEGIAGGDDVLFDHVLVLAEKAQAKPR